MADDKKGTDDDDGLYGGTGDDTLDGGAGRDRLEAGRGDDTFIQNFNDVGDNTIADFDPDEDTIDFQGIDSSSELSITETEDGNTLIDVGNGSTLTITGVTPDQLTTDNVTIGGESLSEEDLTLQSTLVDLAAATASTDVGLDALSDALGGDEASTDIADLGSGADNLLNIALGSALDGATQQGGAPADNADDTGSGAVGSDIVAGETGDAVQDEDQVDGGGG